MSLADYLAKNYLTADPTLSDKHKKKKKRKKDNASGGGGITIADDDAMGWDDERKKNDDDDEGGTLIVRDGHSSDFRKKKFSNWITTPGSTANNDDDHGAAEAAAVLAQARLEHEAQDLESHQPGSTIPSTATMESGAVAGLQTASQVRASLAKKRAQDLADLNATKSLDPALIKKSQETIYRDASGRIVNISLARAETRKAAEAAKAKEEADKLLLKGDIQLLNEQEKKKQLDEVKFKGLNRFKDDEELNEELKAKERWSDPALGFLSKGGKDSGLSRTGKKVYQGPWQPNRYGIRPGHRWDGVDRGNGFEKKWFEARGKKQANRELEYQWEMDE